MLFWSVLEMNQFSMSAAWYPQWVFLFFRGIILTPFVFPMRGAYRFMLAFLPPIGSREIFQSQVRILRTSDMTPYHRGYH